MGVGVYCTPNLPTAMGYTNQFKIHDKKYILVIMCKVQPDKVKFSQVTDYWVINDPQYIVPYALLFKEQ